MKLSVIIVSWNVRDLLRRCVQSLAATTGLELEVIVIDNNSSDNSAAMVRSEFPHVRLIANETNNGFAAANNQGFALATSDYIMMLNPDTEVRPNALSLLVEQLIQQPQIGLIGPALLNADGTRQRSVRRNPSVADQTAVLLKMINVLPSVWPLRQYLCWDFDYAQAATVEQLMGAALLFRRSLLEKIGTLDESFYLWFEEVDFCRRTQQAGFQLLYFPAAEIIHHGKASFRQHFTLRLQMMFNRSLLTYMKKHSNPIAVAWLYLMLPFNLLLTWLYSFVKG